MRIIDANTGTEVIPGEVFWNINGRMTLLRVEEGTLSAKGLFQWGQKKIWVPLKVRYTHPSFFLEKVAFIPS